MVLLKQDRAFSSIDILELIGVDMAFDRNLNLSGRCGRAVPRGSLTAVIAACLCCLLALPAFAVAAQASGPPPPEGLEVFARQQDLGLRVTLSWNHRPGCSAYRVYRADSENGRYMPVGGLSAESMEAFPFFLDDSAAGGRVYYYRVSAVDGDWNEGPQGSPVRAVTARARRAAAGPKSMLVSLADQRAYFFESGVIVNILRVSTGAGGTPTGNYRILAHRGTVSGCNYWMDWRPNYGMHAWPSYLGGYEENLGVTPRSHGCIRLHPLEASWPYYWAPDGTPLTIIPGAHGGLPLKGSSCSSGATAPSKDWYFAEGYIDSEFIEYLLFFNPGHEEVRAKTVYHPEGRPELTETYTLPPGSRQTISVNGVSGLPPSIGHSVEIHADGPVVVQQSEYFNMANRRGGSCSTGVTGPSRSWYFSEGYTGAFFSTYLLLFNTGGAPATCHVTYYVAGGSPYFHDFTMPPGTRGTTLVNALPGLDGKEISIRVDSSEPLVAQRAVYFDWTGNPHYVNGGDVSSGVTAPGKTWYLAEGCTANYFDEYILMLNPGGETANVTFEFCTSEGPFLHAVTLPAYSRNTLTVDSILPAADTGAIVTSDREIVVERAMYCSRDSRRGGDSAAAVPSPSREWYFAEGFTGGTFDEYLLVMNPNPEPSTVNLIFHLENGGDVEAQYVVGPKSRFTLHVDEIAGLEWTSSAVELHADRPVVTEQAHYFCMPR